MPDNLKITAPVTSTEGINKPNPAAQSQNVNPANPSKVPRTNEDGKGKDLNEYLLEENSVFSKFIEKFHGTPSLDRTLGKIIEAACAESRIPAKETTTEDIPMRDFVAKIPAGKEDMLESLLFQQGDATIFSGELFELFKEISVKSNDPQFDLRLANFLKSFQGYFSAENITGIISHNLEKIESEIPAPYAKQLKSISAKVTADTGGHAESNLTVLKKEIIPYLGKYVAKTNDYGKAREDISMLLHNVSQLESSPKSNLSAKFHDLVSYCKYNLRLPDVTISLINSYFARAVSKNIKKPDNKFFKSLISILSGGTKNGGGGIEKSVFKDACTSMLLDNSVYMPFTHLYLPVNWQGKSMFAQIWVEKDSTGTGPQADVQEKHTCLYLTFEIQELGYFEAEIKLFGRKTGISMNCPEALRKQGSKIAPGISKIFSQNGLEAGDVKLSFGKEPQIGQKISEKIYERKRAIDVSV